MSDQTLSARRLLNQQSVGVLSTHSIALEGYPFGSIVPYVLNYEGEPTMLISDIAQHTRNIKENNKVSLIVFDQLADDSQASGRLTWLGDAELVDTSLDKEISARYLRYFPQAASYFDTHDFSFYKISLRRVRFIGGFGQIYWVERDDMLQSNPFRENEADIIEQINRDYAPAFLHYSEKLVGEKFSSVKMVGLDSEGCDLMADKSKIRLDFKSPVSTAEEVHTHLANLIRLDLPTRAG